MNEPAECVDFVFGLPPPPTLLSRMGARACRHVYSPVRLIESADGVPWFLCEDCETAVHNRDMAEEIVALARQAAEGTG